MYTQFIINRYILFSKLLEIIFAENLFNFYIFFFLSTPGKDSNTP